ncbi:MAG: transporter suffix domain-containing protein [Pseudomonadales bacterium]
MRKFIGYSLMIISCLAFSMLPIIPFLDWDTARKVAWGTGVVVFAEITWWLAIPFLGKEIVEFSRRWWKKIKGWHRNSSPG